MKSEIMIFDKFLIIVLYWQDYFFYQYGKIKVLWKKNMKLFSTSTLYKTIV